MNFKILGGLLLLAGVGLAASMSGGAAKQAAERGYTVTNCKVMVTEPDLARKWAATIGAQMPKPADTDVGSIFWTQVLENKLFDYCKVWGVNLLANAAPSYELLLSALQAAVDNGLISPARAISRLYDRKDVAKVAGIDTSGWVDIQF